MKRWYVRLAGLNTNYNNNIGEDEVYVCNIYILVFTVYHGWYSYVYSEVDF